MAAILECQIAKIQNGFVQESFPNPPPSGVFGGWIPFEELLPLQTGIHGVSLCKNDPKHKKSESQCNIIPEKEAGDV